MAYSSKIITSALVITFFCLFENSSANILIYKNDTLRYAKAVQCKGTTLKGTRCRKMTRNQSGYCWYHNNTPLLFKTIVLDSVSLKKYQQETAERKKKQPKSKAKKQVTK